MKLAIIDRETETNLPPAAAFRIGNASKMFAILADKIYSDKIGAVVREIPCNALDASWQTDRPFLVAAPNDIDPAFSVRDFGPGLSDEDVVGLYTTFFDSSKTGSNDQIGGFGLGSKSPFAYTDAFTVAAYQNGEKRVYAAFRGDDSIPQIVLASREPTSEEDGLEVKVPVKTGDRLEFVHKAQQVLKWFPPGSYQTLGFTVKPVTSSVRAPTWLLRPQQDEPYHEVLMGPVAYRLDWHACGVEPLPRGVVPIFQIGELDLPPSREAISYDPITIRRLVERHTAIVLEIGPQLLDKAEAMGPLERLRYKSELQSAGMEPVFRAYHQAAGHYDEDKLARELSGNRFNYQPKWGTLFLAEHEHIRIASVGKEYVYKRKRGSYAHYNSYSGVLTKPGITTPAEFDRTTFVFHDLTEERAPKVKERMASLTYLRTWLIEPSVEVPTIEALRRLFSDGDPAKFIPLSSIPVAQSTRRASTAGELQLRHYDPRYCNFSISTGSVPDCGIYMPMSNAEPDLPSILARLAEQIGSSDIWGLSKKAQAELLDDNWERVDDYVRRRAAELLPDHLSEVHTTRLWEKVTNDRLFNFVRFRTDAKFLPELFFAVRQFGEPTKTAKWLIAVADQGLITLPKVEDEYDIVRLLKKEHRRNKSLDLILQISSHHIVLSTTGEHDEILERFVK